MKLILINNRLKIIIHGVEIHNHDKPFSQWTTLTYCTMMQSKYDTRVKIVELTYILFHFY